jgi:hypothetical protein
MKRERQIYNALMRAVKEGCVPFGYGPETCRWATPDEMRRFGLKDCPMVHLDESGEIDCYRGDCSFAGFTSLRKRSPMRAW